MAGVAHGSILRQAQDEPDAPLRGLLTMRAERISSLVRTGHSRTFRRRSAFAMTETELAAIAAAAMIGESSQPKTG